MILVRTSSRDASRKIILSASSTASLDSVSRGVGDLLGVWPGRDVDVRASAMIKPPSHDPQKYRTNTNRDVSDLRKYSNYPM
jgi:hypothetical protein